MPKAPSTPSKTSPKKKAAAKSKPAVKAPVVKKKATIKVTSMKAPQDIAAAVRKEAAFKRGLSYYLVSLLMIGAVALLAVFVFRPIDTTYYYYCKNVTNSIPHQYYFRRMFGQTEEYYSSIGAYNVTTLNPNRDDVPAGCTVQSFSLYLF